MFTKPNTYLCFGLLIGLMLFGVADPQYSRGVESGKDASTLSYLKAAGHTAKGNYAVPYFMGQLYYSQGEQKKAISAWETYLAMSPPKDSKSLAVKERLTVLKLRQAKEEAQKMLKAGTVTPPAKKDGKETLAVLNFTNTGDPTNDALVKGLSAMLITDLSHVKQLKVIERIRMSVLMDELQMAQTGIVDAESAAKLGRFLMAQRLVWGDLNSPEHQYLKITSNIGKTSDPVKNARAQTEGPQKKFFEMEKTMVFSILESLGIKWKDLPKKTQKAITKIHTRNMDALMAYGRGLAYLDEGHFFKAHNEFQQAVMFDPGFDLAQEALESTPRVDDMRILPIVEVAHSDVEKNEKDLEIAAVDEEENDREIDVRNIRDAEDVEDFTPPFEQPAGDDGNDEPLPPEPTPEPVSGIPTSNASFIVTTAYFSSTTSAMVYRTNTPQNPDNQPMEAQDIATDNTLQFSQNADGTADIQDIMVPEQDVYPGALDGLPYALDETIIGSNSYMEWGSWIGADPQTTMDLPVSGYSYYVNNPAYFVTGDATTAEQMSALAAANVSGTYNGAAEGNYWTANGGIPLSGDFSAQVNFQSGDIRNFNLSMSNPNETSAGITGATGSFDAQGGVSSFAVTGGTWDINGEAAIGYDNRGSFYGPNAESMGGVLHMINDSGEIVNGLYQGDRQ